MADIKLGNLFWDITGKTGNLDKEVNKAQSKISKFGQSLTSIGKKLTTRITAPILGVGLAALKSAADFEKQRVAFETLLGSATKAQRLLKQIEDFSASTPFQLPGLIEGSKRLLAFGESQETVVDTLRRLGNAAQGNQEILDRLTLAYGKLQAKGRASLEELNMFTEAGVPILAALAEQYGVTNQELFKLISSGKVGFEDVNLALTNLTTGTGKFAGLIEKQSGTLSGAFSTFKDNLALAGRALVEGLLPPLTELLQEATKIIKGFAKLDDDTKKLILTIAALAAGIGPLATAIGGLITLFTGPAGIVFAVGAAGAALGAFIAQAEAAKQKKIAESYGDLAENFKLTKEEAEELALILLGVERTGLGIRDAAGFAESLAIDFGIAKDQAIDLILQTESLGEETAALLTKLRDEAKLRRELNSTEDVLLEKAEARRIRAEELNAEYAEAKELARQQALQEQRILDALKKQQEALRQGYLSARELVIQILEGEKTEYEKIEEQLDILASHPWAGGQLEAERLQAIEILRQKLADLNEEELQAEDQKNAQIVSNLARQFDALTATKEEFVDFYDSLREIKAEAIENDFETTIEAVQRTEEATQEILQQSYEAERARQLELIALKVKLAQDALGIASNLDSALDQFSENELQRLRNQGATEEELDEKKKQLDKKAFARKKALAIGETIINTAAAIVGFLSDPGGIPGVGLSIAAGITGAVQLAAIISQPPPALQEGGVLQASPGGRVVQVAEAGDDEAVIPLNEQGVGAIAEAISEANESSTGESGRVIQNNITIPDLGIAFVQKINVALRNGEIIVDARELTNLNEAIQGA